MKSKLFLKKPAKAALLFFSLAVPLLTILNGCQNQIESTYKEEDIPYLVKDICRNEYSLEVTTKRTANTLWIYAPLDKIMHKDYGIKEDKIFDEEMSEKLRQILMTIGRVLISCDNTPEFFALVASDIKIGLDYIIIGNILDMKKSFAGFLPWTEANRRYVIGFKIAPETIGDTEGKHLKFYDIKLGDFLAEQIAQRINVQFQHEGRNKYFKVKKSQGAFRDDKFIFEYDIEQIAGTEQKTDIKKEILETIGYLLKSYEFKDFLVIEINDLASNDKLVLSRVAIWSKAMQ
jgi:hypothetical protein